MKTLCVLTVCLLFLVRELAWCADDVAVAKAKATLILAKVQRERCEVTLVAEKEAAKILPPCYRAKLELSRATGKILIVVVNHNRPDLEKQTSWIVVEVKSFEWPNGQQINGPALIVSRNGRWLKTLPASATVADIRGAL